MGLHFIKEQWARRMNNIKLSKVNIFSGVLIFLTLVCYSVSVYYFLKIFTLSSYTHEFVIVYASLGVLFALIGSFALLKKVDLQRGT